MDWIDAEVWEMIEMVDFFEKGMPPVAGGLLDQTAYFVKFAGFTQQEARQYRKRFED